MNYRHAYHAGNFADVFKHLVLTRVLAYLARKETAFRVIDTHAGEGLYDLASEAAVRTAEWRQGIGRLLDAAAPDAAAPRPAALAQLIDPYLGLIAASLRQDPPLYLGSPALAAAFMRRQDRMICCEAHPAAAAALRAHMAHDKRIKIIEIDGFMGLGAYVPPIERRGLVLIDPPYEAVDEFAQILAALETALRKWPTGTYMIWFPIKDQTGVADFCRQLGAIASGRNTLRLDFWIDRPEEEGPLRSNGLALINPPYVLDEEARIILPYLAQVLGLSAHAGYFVGAL